MHFKSYVRNQNHLEGYMVECYVAEKATKFWSKFLARVKPIGKDGWVDPIDYGVWAQKYRIVFNNLEKVQPYIN